MCQTKDAVSQHPRLCTHDQHFGTRPSDLNLGLGLAQKAAGGFVSGEKLLGMSEAKELAVHVSKRKLSLG